MVAGADPVSGVPPKQRRRRRWAAIATPLGLMAVLGALAIGVFGGSWDSSEGSAISIEDERFAVDLTVPDGVGIDGVHARADDGDPDCRKVLYGFGDELTIEAVAKDCRIESPQNVINGDHGTYRTLADVSEPVDVRQVDTGIGRAEVFVQNYEEHTNISSEWEEPVAIVTLDAPDDPDFPTLVLRSAKGELSRDRFTEVVASLEPATETSAG